jgi:hypothetical protein
MLKKAPESQNPGLFTDLRFALAWPDQLTRIIAVNIKDIVR